MHLGEWFDAKRKARERGLRAQLAEAADVSMTTVTGWTQGWVMPRPDKIRVIEVFTEGQVTGADLLKGYRGPRAGKSPDEQAAA